MKDIVFMGSSYRIICAFPNDAKRKVGFQLYYVQAGVRPDNWKPMGSIGVGVKEIRIQIDNEYRVIYTANFENSIYVLHAFTKKTNKTDKNDINIAKRYFNEIKRMNHEK